MGAWNGWYHVNGNTYGTWLPGDPRGWRSRHHREHVDGDYKAPPPPGTYDALHAANKNGMPSGAVFLSAAHREIAGRAVVEMLVHQGVELLAISLDAIHYHVLARFGAVPARQAVGRAKKHAHFTLQASRPGRVWAKRSRTLPVRNRKHQVNVYEYIRRHGNKGAWVWTFQEGIYWESTMDGMGA